MDLGEGVFEDYWGIRSVHLKASHGSYDMHVHTPLWDAETVGDLEKHDWPWPDIFDYSVMREQRAAWDDKFVMYEGADLFTRPCILRNMENVMEDLVLRPDMVHCLLETGDLSGADLAELELLIKAKKKGARKGS